MLKHRGRFVYIIPFVIYFTFIQTIQLVRLSAIFGFMVLLYVVALVGDFNNDSENVSDYR